MGDDHTAAGGLDYLGGFVAGLREAAHTLHEAARQHSADGEKSKKVLEAQAHQLAAALLGSWANGLEINADRALVPVAPPAAASPWRTMDDCPSDGAPAVCTDAAGRLIRPPQPMMHANAEWHEKYARWHQRYVRALLRQEALPPPPEGTP